MVHHAHNPKVMLPQVEGDPSVDFGADWIEAWSRSENYRIWDRYTDSHLFDIVEPKHPCAGGLTIEDVQRRLSEQVKEFHLDERFAVGKEVLGRNLAAGKEKASTVFNKLYADMEALRESQRRKHEEARREAERNGLPSPGFQAPDLNGARQTVQSVSSKAGAYIGSWGTWVGEKRKTGWGRSASVSQKKEKENLPSLPPRPIEKVVPIGGDERPKTNESYKESLFDADGAPSPKKSAMVDEEHKPIHHYPVPSRFHEAVDEDDESVKAVPVSDELGGSAKEWADESKAKKDVDVEAEERNHKVAEALEAASGTPISP